MSALSYPKIIEKLKYSQKELFEIAKMIKPNSEARDVEDIQNEINKRLEKMKEKNNCDELGYSIMKKFFYIISFFEDNVYLFFSKHKHPYGNTFRNDIINEYNNIYCYLSKEDNDFFYLYYINKNLKTSLENFSQDRGEAVFFLFEILKELNEKKNNL